MKLNSKLFIVIMAFMAVFSFIAFSIDSSHAATQNTSGKATAKADPILVTFVEIGAARCIPCKAMQPIMKAVEEEYKGQVKVIFHDVWTPQGKADAMKYNIRMIPTQVFLDKDGKEYYRHEGYFPKEDLVKIIKMQGVR